MLRLALLVLQPDYPSLHHPSLRQAPTPTAVLRLSPVLPGASWPGSRLVSRPSSRAPLLGCYPRLAPPPLGAELAPYQRERSQRSEGLRQRRSHRSTSGRRPPGGRERRPSNLRALWRPPTRALPLLLCFSRSSPRLLYYSRQCKNVPGDHGEMMLALDLAELGSSVEPGSVTGIFTFEGDETPCTLLSDAPRL